MGRLELNIKELEPALAQMDNEINAMERQITRLQGELDALSSRRASVVG